MSCYLQMDSAEDQLMAIRVLVGVGLSLAIIDVISIAIAYSQSMRSRFVGTGILSVARTFPGQ
jgi:hypothetical protein